MAVGKEEPQVGWLLSNFVYSSMTPAIEDKQGLISKKARAGLIYGKIFYPHYNCDLSCSNRNW